MCYPSALRKIRTVKIENEENLGELASIQRDI